MEMWVDDMYDELIQEAELCDKKLNKKQNSKKDKDTYIQSFHATRKRASSCRLDYR